MTKRSNPSRNVPHPDHEAGAMLGDRSRRVPLQNGGTMPVTEAIPRRPPVCVLYEDLVAPEDMPQQVYGMYPKILIAKVLPWLRCERHEILHVCSGGLPPGEGIRVDIRPAAKPDILADGRKLPIVAGTIAAAMIDPPYSAEYAKSLYGVEYPRPSHLLREAARVVRPGGRIAIVHYITPKPAKGTTFVKAFGLSTGFDMPMRAVSIYERAHRAIDLGTTPEQSVPVAECKDCGEALPTTDIAQGFTTCGGCAEMRRDVR